MVIAKLALLVPIRQVQSRLPVFRVPVEPQPTKLDLHHKHSVLVSRHMHNVKYKPLQTANIGSSSSCEPKKWFSVFPWCLPCTIYWVLSICLSSSSNVYVKHFLYRIISYYFILSMEFYCGGFITELRLWLCWSVHDIFSRFGVICCMMHKRIDTYVSFLP